MYSDDDYLKRVVFDLLTYGRTSFSKTSEFKFKKHNEHLVPQFNNKFNDILDCFDRYRRMSQDIQGVRDGGIDVLIKYEIDGSDKYIGIQVKSHDDLKPKDWLSKLKAQLIDVQSQTYASDLTDFYVVMCADIESHKDKLRNATADLSKIKDFKVHVIQPENALYFLELPDYIIGAYLKRKFSDRDFVLLKAEEGLAGLTLAQSAMVIEGASNFVSEGKMEFNYDDISDSYFVDQVYKKYPNLPASYYDNQNSHAVCEFNTEQWDVDAKKDLLDVIDKDYFELPSYTETIKFNQERSFALLSLMYDAKIRYSYEQEDLKWYAFYTLKEYELNILKELKSPN